MEPTKSRTRRCWPRARARGASDSGFVTFAHPAANPGFFRKVTVWVPLTPTWTGLAAALHVDCGTSVKADGTVEAVARDLGVLRLRAAGFTTVLDMDSRGGFNTVDLRDAINAGLVQGPRMQVVGQSINQRAGNYYPDDQSVRFLEGFTENKNVNSPWLARAAVREAKLHGVDWIKIYTTQDFVGPMHMWKPDATLVASPSLTLEEVEAIVDEAHGWGKKVACHAYNGVGLQRALDGGCDSIEHGLEITNAQISHAASAKLA